MKKIDLSIEEIVSKYGYASEILECIDLSVVPEDQENFVVSKITEYRNFYNELYVATEYENRIEITRKIIEVLKEIEQYINRRKYMYLSYRSFTTKKELAESGLGPKLTPREAELLADVIKYIRDADLLSTQDVKFEEGSPKAIIKTSEDFLGQSSRRRNRELVAKRRFEMISEKIDMDELISQLWPSDLIYVCRYQELGSMLADRLMQPIDANNDAIQQGKFTDEELATGKQYIIAELIETTKANIEYMDIDKLLMLIVKRCYDDLRSQALDVDQDALDKFIDILKKLQKFIPEEKRTLNERQTEKINLDEVLDYSVKMSRRFINGSLTFEQDVEEVRRCLLSGEMGFSEISARDYTSTMFFTKAELLEIAAHDVKAIEFFAKEGFLTEEDLDELKSPRRLVELYMDKEKSPENAKEFEIYRKIFKGLVIDGKTDEEKEEVGLLIADQNQELLDENRLRELYNLGLITCDNYVGLVGNEALRDLVEKGEIKPVDVRKMFDRGSISINDFKSILESSGIENEEKLLLIYSTFPTKEDRIVRDELVQFLTDIVEDRERRAKPQGEDEDHGHNNDGNNDVNPEPPPKPRIKEVYDPCAKWAFLAALDPDYSKKYYPRDGHVIMFLPNRGTYIIEKLYDRTQRKGMPRYAYGSATYVMTEEEFEASKSDLIQDGKIDRTVLSQLHRDKAVKKFVHKGWAQSICKYFGLDVPDRYTEEQKREIRKLAEEVENSKIME